MKNNLLPPFILRQAGIEVNDVPKIHTNEPTQSTHSVKFTETGFTIPLSLWGTFSYFPTSKPKADDMQASDEIYLLTPSTFNPHDDSMVRTSYQSMPRVPIIKIYSNRILNIELFLPRTSAAE